MRTSSGDFLGRPDGLPDLPFWKGLPRGALLMMFTFPSPSPDADSPAWLQDSRYVSQPQAQHQDS